MSATGRGAKRFESDYYPTPEWCVHSLLKAWQPPFTGGWLEPCVGDGAIIRAVSNHYQNSLMPEWTAIDIRGDATDFMQLPISPPPINWILPQDFLKWKTEDRFSVCLTNPPFTLAREFIEHALTMSDRAAMLLRLNFMGSQERQQFHKELTPDLYILPKRPAFGIKGTDNCEYAWFAYPGEGRWYILDT